METGQNEIKIIWIEISTFFSCQVVFFWTKALSQSPKKQFIKSTKKSFIKHSTKKSRAFLFSIHLKLFITYFLLQLPFAFFLQKFPQISPVFNQLENICSLVIYFWCSSQKKFIISNEKSAIEWWPIASPTDQSKKFPIKKSWWSKRFSFFAESFITVSNSHSTTIF